LVFSTEKFTAHISVVNYLLNNLILLVIKISLTGDMDAPIFSTEKFTAHILRGNYFLNKIIKIVIKNSLIGDRTRRSLAQANLPLTSRRELFA
jgi:hypothetical protein